MKLTESNIIAHSDMDALIKRLPDRGIELIIKYDVNCIYCDWVIVIRFRYFPDIEDVNSPFTEYALLIITDDNAYDKNIERISITLQYLIGIRKPQTSLTNWDMYVEILRNEIYEYIAANILPCNKDNLVSDTAIVFSHEEFKKSIENNEYYKIY